MIDSNGSQPHILKSTVIKIEAIMWKTFEEARPENSGWILLSTNKGLAYARYDKEEHQLGRVYLLGDLNNTTDQIKHWAPIEDQPHGDYDPNSSVFQRFVK
jgi:hypothetical protein